MLPGCEGTFEGDHALLEVGHIQGFEEESRQVAKGPSAPEAVLQGKGVGDGVFEKGGDIGYGIEGDGFGWDDGADVATVTGTPSKMESRR